MKLGMFLAIAFFAPFVWAQTVTCTPHGEAHYRNLEISQPDLPFEVSWFSVRLENKYSQRQIFTVVPVLRNQKLSFLSKDNRSEFSLNFAEYKGPGTYHAVELVLNKGSAKEEKAELMCNVVAELPVADACVGVDQKKALHQSASNRNVIELESALECGANSNAKNEFGCSALLLAADPFCGQSMPSPIAFNPLTSALPIVDLLTNNGAMIEAKDPLTSESALHKFTKLGDFDVVSLLLDLEAEVDGQDSNGFTSLMRAVEKNDKFLVSRIVEAGPDLALKNKNGQTALDIAVNLGFKKLEPLLQEPSTVIEISGQQDGLCTPQQIHLSVNKLSKIVLKASDAKMFLLEASGLGLNLMAGAGGSVSQNVMPKQTGSIAFTCGVHGASKQTKGEILVH